MSDRFPSRVSLEQVGRPFRAVAILYNAYLTGLILTVTLEEGKAAAGELIFRVYRQPSSAVFEAWNGLWEGALLTHNRFLRWQVDSRMDLGDVAFVWRIRRRHAAPEF